MDKFYKVIALAIGARKNCEKFGNTEWYVKWTDKLHEYEKRLPSGSGFDCGTKIDLDKSTEHKLVLTTSYHYMNEDGYYDGWTEHTITIKPSLLFDFTLVISGRDQNEFKDYAYEVFQSILSEELEFDETRLP